MPMWMLLLATTSAQSTPAGHIEIPSSSIATEDGPGTMFVNPANLAYDPDPHLGLFFDRPAADGDRTSLAIAGGFSGISLGLQGAADPLGVLHWEVDASTGLQLPGRLAIGATTRWRLVPRRPNTVAFDLATSWRPARWFGASFVAQTVGNPDVTERISPQTRYGIALHPAKVLMLGLEQIVDYQGRRPAFSGRANVRIRATEGLYLRGHVESDFDVERVSAGGALEFYFGGTGLALGGRTVDDQPFASGWIGSGEPGESLFRGRKRVVVANLTRAPRYQPRGRLLGGETGSSWLETLQDLKRLETDKECGGVVITLGSAGLGMARLSELRDRILGLEKAGKPVTAFLTGSIDTGNYYAASAASKILMHPAAVLDLTGLSVELQHYRGLMDMVGVEAQVVRRSEYKAAAEPFSTTEPSPEQLEQLNALLDDLYGEVVSGVAEGRKLGEDDVMGRIDGGPYLAKSARDAGLVDDIAYPDQVEGKVRSSESTPVVNLSQLPDGTLPWETPARIAVIYVDGVINTGASSDGGLLSGRSAGSATIVRQLDRARQNPAVKAVVLRVDSPGGSAFASDEILRAVERFRNKPLVVSMGGLAASGGYYISSKADAIWATPATLTGSIGVISYKLSADPLFESLGITHTRIERGENAGISSQFSAWDPGERKRSQELIDGIYDQFKSHVEAGRDMTPDAVEEVARGRIWSGLRAAENGLVDKQGGLLEAIADARERAGIPVKREMKVTSERVPTNLVDQLNPIPTLKTHSDVPAIFEGLQPVMTFVLHPEERTWMLEPWVREVQ